VQAVSAPVNEELIAYLSLGSSKVQQQGFDRPAPPSSNTSSGCCIGLKNVTLACCDLERMREFYAQVLGFQVFRVCDDEVTMGRQNEILKLLHKPLWSKPAPQQAKLFHMGLKFPTNEALAANLGRILSLHPELYKTSADHGYAVSFYIDDVEGNCLELYVERPPEQWPRRRGQIAPMPRKINIADWIHSNFDSSMNDSWDMQTIELGHVHLRVGNLALNRHFYSRLGLVPTLSLPSVLFMGNPDDHQLVSMNTWDTIGKTTQLTNVSGLQGIELLHMSSFATDNVSCLHNVSSNLMQDPQGIEIMMEDVLTIPGS
jgi:catechol 2,3-dioxygenase